jgi:arylsulfatase A-like enzyme
MNRLLSLFAFLALSCGHIHAVERARPNVVFILADDLGWRDIGCFGSTFHRTPNLDRLAARGVKFTQAYAANPLCSPTRASILTGLWPARTGITTPACHEPQVVLEKGLAKGRPNQRVLEAQSVTRLKTDYMTLPKLLKQAGYATGHFGKWHLGREPYSPLQHGFDVDWPHWWGPGPEGYIAPWKYPPAMGIVGQPGEHIEDTLSSKAAQFIRENKNRPFYLNYWQFSVHCWYEAKPALVEKYRKPADPKNPQRNPLYAAMVESLDDGVGRVMAALEECGLMDNTIIVFCSDNGGVDWASPRVFSKDHPDLSTIPITSNTPLRGGKANCYEGGVRVPCIVVWPGFTTPGASNDTVIQSIDWMPTLLEVTGVPLPAETKPDGISIVPALKGGALERDAIFCHFPHDLVPRGQYPATTVRRGDWKLHRIHAGNDDGTDRLELYNLRNDLGETANLANAQPEIARALNALITRFLKDTEAVIPKLNPSWKAPVAQGWQVSGDTRLHAENGELRITSTGKDPWISTRDLPSGAGGPFVLQLRIKSDGSGAGVVYFTDEPQGVFGNKQLVTFPLKHDGAFHDYEVKIPAERLTGLRLDPGNAPGPITVAQMELCDAKGDRLRNLGGDADKRLMLDNGRVKVGIERSKGASITWLSGVGHSENIVNYHDPGRLIQQSYYAGLSLDRRAEGQSKVWSPWPWNPIQGGGVSSWARATVVKRLDDGTLYSETLPKLWDMPDEEAAALMRQWTGIEPERPEAVVVRCELVCQRVENDRWGPARACDQELPACYFTRNFSVMKSYLGEGKWRVESQKPGPPWGRANPPRKAMAFFNPQGYGVAVFSPAADQPWSFGPHGEGASSDPVAGPCMYIGPMGKAALGPKAVFRFRYWITLGTEAELANRLDALWERYSRGEMEQPSQPRPDTPRPHPQRRRTP